LTRIGMGKLGRLGMDPAQRYERERPGELIHIDVKTLGRTDRGAGHRITGRRLARDPRRLSHKQSPLLVAHNPQKRPRELWRSS
jgi:hypothetical protein